MADTRSRFQIKLAAAKRYTMWHLLSKPLDLICVTEYPKCGASWLCQILEDYTNLPFPRNVSPKLETSIMHGHFLPNKRFNRSICFIRDGRDVVVSFYHHLLLGNNKMSIHSVPKFRKLMPFVDYQDVEGNLPRFIEYLFAPKPVFPDFSWKTFCDKMISQQHFYIKYEEMLTNTVQTVAKTLQYLFPGETIDIDKLATICERYSFKSQSNLESQNDNAPSYLRKGIAGDWKNYFNKEACQIFDKHTGSTLIQLGYEKDNSWAKKINRNAVN